jgi:hypothetical protein
MKTLWDQKRLLHLAATIPHVAERVSCVCASVEMYIHIESM